LAVTPYVEPAASSESEGIEHVAALADTATVSPPVQVTVDPWEGVIAKVTLPVAPGVTFAVKEAAWPETDGFTEGETVIVLGAFVYVKVLADPVPASLVTVTFCAPTPPASAPVGV
jgi:hypothetical protein